MAVLVGLALNSVIEFSLYLKVQGNLVSGI